MPGICVRHCAAVATSLWAHSSRSMACWTIASAASMRSRSASVFVFVGVVGFMVFLMGCGGPCGGRRPPPQGEGRYPRPGLLLVPALFTLLDVDEFLSGAGDRDVEEILLLDALGLGLILLARAERPAEEKRAVLLETLGAVGGAEDNHLVRGLLGEHVLHPIPHLLEGLDAFAEHAHTRREVLGALGVEVLPLEAKDLALQPVGHPGEKSFDVLRAAPEDHRLELLGDVDAGDHGRASLAKEVQAELHERGVRPRDDEVARLQLAADLV